MREREGLYFGSEMWRDRQNDRYSVGFRKTIFLEEINFPLQQF